jgi:hypothetical protein
MGIHRANEILGSLPAWTADPSPVVKAAFGLLPPAAGTGQVVEFHVPADLVPADENDRPAWRGALLYVLNSHAMQNGVMRVPVMPTEPGFEAVQLSDGDWRSLDDGTPVVDPATVRAGIAEELITEYLAGRIPLSDRELDLVFDHLPRPPLGPTPHQVALAGLERGAYAVVALSATDGVMIHYDRFRILHDGRYVIRRSLVDQMRLALATLGVR